MTHLVNDLSSTVLIFTTYWLTHSFARDRRYCIAGALAVGGFSLLLSIIYRNSEIITGDGLVWQGVVTKTAFAVALGLISYRRHRVDLMHGAIESRGLRVLDERGAPISSTPSPRLRRALSRCLHE